MYTRVMYILNNGVVEKVNVWINFSGDRSWPTLRSMRVYSDNLTSLS